MNIDRASTVVGHLAGPRDSSFFKVKLEPGAYLTAHLDMAANADYDLYFYNSNGTLIAVMGNGRGMSEEVRVMNPNNVAFTRYIQVVYHSGALGDAAPYQLKFSF